MSSFEDRLIEYKNFIEQYLKDFYGQFQDLPQKKLLDAMQYS